MTTSPNAAATSGSIESDPSAAFYFLLPFRLPFLAAAIVVRDRHGTGVEEG